MTIDLTFEKYCFLWTCKAGQSRSIMYYILVIKSTAFTGCGFTSFGEFMLINLEEVCYRRICTPYGMFIFIKLVIHREADLLGLSYQINSENIPNIRYLVNYLKNIHAINLILNVYYYGNIFCSIYPLIIEKNTNWDLLLGPVLFLIFINDLPDNIRSSVQLFADDCVLYRNIKSPLDCHILQDDLNSLARWEMDWQMKFNVSKCHSMRVTRLHPSNHIQFSYTLHQQTLEQVQSAKYLGLTITDSIDWGQHISEITCKATKTLGFLRRNLALAPRHTKEVAYKTLVRPQLEYAAPIWHPYNETQTAKVEKVQKTAARWTCWRWRNSSSVGDMLDELEWPSLQFGRERSSLTFFYKIHFGTVSLDKDKYLTPAPNLRRTRAPHESQYTRQFAYSDALKISFSPRTISACNSLPSSVVSSKTILLFNSFKPGVPFMRHMQTE